MNLELYPEPVVEAESLEAGADHYRILVVDDEVSMREFAVEALALGGYQATAVEGGVAAMIALKAEPYNLVLTDFNMPNGSGSDLIIKMHQEGFLMPVILMTGGSLTKELMTLMSMLHVGGILQKPFRIDELLDAVEKVLRPVQEASVGLTHSELATGTEHAISHGPHKRRF